MVICLEQGADLHMAQPMPLPLTVSCCSKIQIGFTFLVPAQLGSPGQRAVKRVCVMSSFLWNCFSVAQLSTVYIYYFIVLISCLGMGITQGKFLGNGNKT